MRTPPQGGSSFATRCLVCALGAHRVPLLATLLSALLLAGLADLRLVPAARAAGADPWTQYLYDANHTSYNANFTAIGPNNAASLVKKWSFKTGATLPANPAVAPVSGAPAAGCAGTGVPVVFAGAWTGYFYAFNANTGALCWKTFLAKDVDPNPPVTGVKSCIPTLGVTSSAAVATVTIGGVPTQVVYAGASDIMFALDAATGQIVWKSILAGADVGAFSPAYIWSSPVYSPANNVLYTSTASFCDEKQPIDGTVFALDPATGTIKAQQAMLPNNTPGAGIWSTPTVSAGLHTVYVTTGQGFTQTATGTAQACVPAQPHTCAVVALDWTTLAVKSSWQITPIVPAVRDDDFGATPVLFPGPNGATWLAAGNKNGYFYVLDAGNVAAGWKWRVKLAIGGADPVKAIVAPAAYYPGTVTTGGGQGCTGVLFVAAGRHQINGVSYPGNVSALCALTGAILWRQGTAGPIWAAPTLANGLLVNQQGATLEVRDWSTGHVLFSYTAGHNIFGAAALANGRIYFGSTDHTMYSLGL